MIYNFFLISFLCLFKVFNYFITHIMKRRRFIRQSGYALGSIGLLSVSACGNNATKKDQKVIANSDMQKADASLPFKISLAEWSLHKALFGNEIDNLDFAKISREEFEIDTIEYVNVFFFEKAKDTTYLDELNKRANDHGIYQNLIMVDREGGMGSLDDKERMKAIDNHKKWVEAAKHLGCGSVRVNAYGEGTADEVKSAAVDGLGRLAEFAKPFGLNVIVENHGGYSSNGAWLADVMNQIDMENCGTLPDFGNFCLERGDDGCIEEYDRYKGVRELMPYAKAVSAKTNDFNAEGDEVHTDYYKMMDIVMNAGYNSYVGIEYEGDVDDEYTGIRKSKVLLEKIQKSKM